MQEKIKKFQEEFSNLKIESKDYHYIFSDDKEQKGTQYNISGLKGNSGLLLYFEESEEADKLSEILRNDLFVFNDFLAIKYNNTIEILLTPISFRTSLRNPEKRDEENFKVIEIGLNYHKNELDISLEVGEENNLLPKFTNFIRGGSRYSRKRGCCSLPSHSR